jgi:hypothetical protein
VAKRENEWKKIDIVIPIAIVISVLNILIFYPSNFKNKKQEGVPALLLNAVSISIPICFV